MSTGWNAKRFGRLLVPLLLLGLALLSQRYLGSSRNPPPAPRAAERAAEPGTRGDRAIADAFQGQRSGVWVESGGVVERLLADDREGARHQRFLLRLDSGQTLLLAHNVDLAPRVPVRRGERIRFRGQYEWNDRGGVVHWTHDDPQRKHPGGWIEYGGGTYR